MNGGRSGNGKRASLLKNRAVFGWGGGGEKFLELDGMSEDGQIIK